MKTLLSFHDVAVELGCDDDSVRTLVVEERALPALYVTQVGYKEPYSEVHLLMVDSQGLVMDFQSPSRHAGYLRVQRSDLESFKERHSATLVAVGPPKAARWPAHETKKLTALRLAAVKFWSNYDPSQPDTAPTSAAVAEWLQKEHGIGATPAAEMASILRPDDLRPGPR